MSPVASRAHPDFRGQDGHWAGLADPSNMPAMPDDDTAQDPLKESQSAQLISDPELQRLLEIIAKRMGLPPESALRRSLETILVMY